MQSLGANALSRRQAAGGPVFGWLTAPPLWLAAGVLALANLVVYWGAVGVPFVFDDEGTIVANRSITSLWPVFGTPEEPGPLAPAIGSPTAGRPLVNLSFAVNYRLGGLNPRGYHVVNILLHYASALLLFGIVRRTLLLPYFGNRFAASADALALVVALIWAVHPLQTEAVVYVTQRTELMMAFFYLATLYCSLRYWTTDRYRSGWLALAVLACTGGMASKEVMVSAPVMVLLFERVFISGSVAQALRRSWPLYFGLAATWILLLVLNLGAPRGTTAGFGQGASLLAWWLTQAEVLVMYLKLAVWPNPLMIHYLLPYQQATAAAWICAASVLVLGLGTLLLLWRNSAIGYLGAWFFAILATTSVVPILTETAAERRMYLPLAALVVLVVVGGFVLIEFMLQRRRAKGDRLASVNALAVVAVPAILLGVVFGLMSVNRVEAYYDNVALWQDVARTQPTNDLARNNLGKFLYQTGRLPEAVEELRAAAKLRPDKPDVVNSLGLALVDSGQLEPGVEALRSAVALDAGFALAENNLGFALTKMGRAAQAIPHLRRAIELQSDFSDAHNNLGIALGVEGKTAESIAEFRRAIEDHNDYVKAHKNLGVVLFQTGDAAGAIDELKFALRLEPNDAQSHYNLAVFLARMGGTQEAIDHFAQAIALSPNDWHAHHSLGNVLAQAGRHKEAAEHFQAVLRLSPDFVPAYLNLAQSLAATDKSAEATAVAEQGVKLGLSHGDVATAQQLDDWLKHYRAELQRSERDPGEHGTVEQPVQ